MRLSILVVSRTPELLNRLLQSLDEGFSGAAEEVEILCSWNGNREAEAQIQPSRLPFAIVQRDPYHFASNMNRLAAYAQGEILVFTNDDLIVDPGAIDAAEERLKIHTNVGLVGARLRTSNGQLAHAGIHFTSYGSPYHQLEHFVDSDHPANLRETVAPAVTGAFFAMGRQDFLKLQLAETFRVCGEDVLLCLQTRSILHKQVLYCPAMSGVHDAESTRSQFEAQQGNADDIKRLRSGWLEMMQLAGPELLAVELRAAQDEAEDLRGRCLELLQLRGDNEQLQAEIQTLQKTTAQMSQLEASRTRQELQQSLVESENKRLHSRIQQLENQLNRLGCQA